MQALIDRGINRIRAAYNRSFSSSSIALIYHRVTDLKVDPQLLSVTPENFYDQVKYLQKNYTLLSIDEFIEIKKNPKRKFPPQSVILTFDDGYADNYLQALPILESLNAQALFYISTSNINTEFELWWDELERIFYSHDLPDFLELEISDKRYSFSTKSVQERETAYRSIFPYIKTSKLNERFSVMEKLRKWSGNYNGRASHKLLTNDQVKKMSCSKSAIIGTHTHTHPTLSILAIDEQLKEIKTSIDVLEGITNIKTKHFSYPYGSMDDYNDNSIQICQQLDLEFVFANFQGHIYHSSNNYELPRFIARNWQVSEFREKMEDYFKQK